MIEISFCLGVVSEVGGELIERSILEVKRRKCFEKEGGFGGIIYFI